MRRIESQTHIPITEKNLYRIALWPHARKWLLAFLPIALLLAVFGIGGRMNAAVTVISMLAVGSFLLIFCLPQLRTQYKSLALLRRIPDFDLLLKDKQLRWQNGAWGYVDGQWFIRVSRIHSAVLRASELDFSVPVRGFSDAYNVSNGMPLHLRRLVFTLLDGKTIFACSEADQNIINWLKQHGGRPDWEKKKRR